jgi:6,7-dimethyl-8-ribityllumazine synthase
MRATKIDIKTRRHDALVALKQAVIEGATWRYEHLVSAAREAGVTDQQLDTAIHEALRILFESAERTFTARQLDAVWPLDRVH